MLYPQNKDAKKAKSIFKNSIIISIIIGVLLIIINKFILPEIHWAECFDIGIIYVWFTVKYALSKNVNIASNLFIQMIILSVISVFIDIRIGFQGWSINLAIPIIIIITNIAMGALAIMSYNNYMRYAYFELLIVFFSFLPMLIVNENIIYDKDFTITATTISGINFLISLLFHFKDLKSEIIRRLHI